MPRGRASKDTISEVPGDGGRPAPERLELSPTLTAWFGANDSSTEHLEGWDVNAAETVEAILYALSKGMGVWFGLTRDGGSVTVTFVDGNAKMRKFAGDAIEWDDLFAVILKNKPKAKHLKVVEG